MAMTRAPGHLSVALVMALLATPPALAEDLLVRPQLDLAGAPDLALSVEARAGDHVRVELPVQAGTGYGWADDVAGDAVAASEHTTEAGGPKLGGTATEAFAYVAQAPGTAEITLTYRRPWLPEAVAARVAISVVVRPGVNP